MNRIYRFFNISDSDEYLLRKKKTALVFVNLLVMGLLAVFIIGRIIQGVAIMPAMYFVLAGLIVFTLTILAIIKFKGFGLAGPVFSVGFVFLIATATSLLSKSDNVLDDYMESLYFLLALLAPSILFANRKFLLLNSAFALIAGLMLFFTNSPVEEYHQFLMQRGTVNYVIALVILTATLYYMSKISDDAEKAVLQSKQTEKANQKLKDLINLVSTSTQLQNELSDQINNSSKELSDVAGMQASNVEEISATVEELSSIVTKNTKNTADTKQFVEKMLRFVDQGKRSVERSNELYKSILEKMKLIDDIAFQTNILSLNASIQASKAGDKGKGFMVVAREVRDLAESSKRSAKEIFSFVERTKSVNQTSEDNMMAIASGVEEVQKAVEALALSAEEQESGFEQINRSIAQVNEAAQKNASLSNILNIGAKDLSKNSQKQLSYLQNYEAD